ncbi:MAG: EndoU domain-containing protein, partial [Candidatus Thiodiazotropha sp.]
HQQGVKAERGFLSQNNAIEQDLSQTGSAKGVGSSSMGDGVSPSRLSVDSANPNSILINQGVVNHSNIGDFPAAGNPKKNPFPSSMLGGGHGQENIKYLDQIGMQYNIEHTYSNGVRVGNIPKHKNKIKRSGFGQSWFPEKWTKSDISAAGQYVIRNTNDFSNVPDGIPVFGIYDHVRVGVIKTNGVPSTIFPDGSKQPSLTNIASWETAPNK